MQKHILNIKIFKFFIVILLFTLYALILPNSAYAVCNCGPTPPADYGSASDKTAWCACAASCSDNGALQDGPTGQGGADACSQANTQDTCEAGVCGKCATKNTCGNTTYDSCDTSPCKAAGATANTTFRCWASKSPNSCSYSENKCGSTCAAPPATACPANTFQLNNCRRCNSDGSAWSTDYGNFDSGEVTKEKWCGCAQQKGDTGSFNRGPKLDGSLSCSGTLAPTGNVDDRSKCSYRFLETATRQRAAYIISQKEYILEVTMENTFPKDLKPPSIWKPGTYKLVFEKNKEDWNGSDQPLTEEITPGESEVFDIRVKAPATTNNEARKAEFFIRMQRDGVGFGAACEPDSVEITPPPPAAAAPVGPVSTQCYVISEDLAEVNRITKCDFNDPLVRPYTQHPVNLNYKFKDTTPGLKNLYVKFLDNNNNPSNENVPYTKTILLAPTPSISSIDCKYIQNELGTSVTVNGLNLGTQGKGTVRVGNQQALVSSWNNTTITSSLEQRLESSARVTVTFDDGKTLSDTCAVNTTTFTFTAKNQCVKDADFSASNVDVKIYETGEEPILRQQIRLDKDGKPQSFTPKLEKDKKYTMVVKAPGTLGKKVEFKTGNGGTTILEPFVLATGDIYPRNAADGKVNSADVSELKRQWSPTRDTQSNGDLNNDNRINNVDWSCMRININKEDESFSPPAIPQTVKIGSKGKVYMDSNDNNVQDTNEQVIAGVLVKLLKVPDTHVVGQRITPAELVNSQSLAQATTASDGSFEISVNRNTPVTGNFAFVVDASNTTGSGGEVDWKITAAINADSIQSWSIPVKP